jgi:hypothetical protein
VKKLGRPAMGKDAKVMRYTLYDTHRSMLSDLWAVFGCNSDSEVIRKLITDAHREKVQAVRDGAVDEEELQNYRHRLRTDMKDFFEEYISMEQSLKLYPGSKFRPQYSDYHKGFLRRDPRRKQLFPNKSIDFVYEFMEQLKGEYNARH